MTKAFSTDVLVIGSGTAGLTCALCLAPYCKVAILCKSNLGDGASLYAQGGIAAVMSTEDSLAAHIEDTLIAGAGLCKREIVEFTVQQAHAAIDWLLTQGVRFDREADEFHLTREGGHRCRRVLHAGDATGSEVQQTLSALVRQQSTISLFEHHLAIDLIKDNHTCIGAYVYNEIKQRVEVFQAKVVVLATGGASRVYLYSTNPVVASGDGIAMSWRAGCRVANLHYNQFHPTCLYHPHAVSFLISEAMRGEGGILKLPNGERFMLRFDERAELAPRDIVARAIDHEMKRLGLDCVYLDISHKPADFIKQRFPTIYQRCLELGIDITREAIPVVPAAHYTCGGVMTDPYGQTDLAHLYAIGEVACTGLHGANRIASNSLLECLVFGISCAEKIRYELSMIALPSPIRPWDESRVIDSDEEIVVSHNWHELRTLMWNYMGIVRTSKRLERAMNRIKLLQQEISEYYQHFRVTRDLLELRNLVLVAELMVKCAIDCQESRGLHYSLNHPPCNQQSIAHDTVLRPHSP